MISISLVVCLIFFIIVITLIYYAIYWVYNRYMKIFNIDFLWKSGRCNFINDEGINVIDKDRGSLFGKNGIYSYHYCALNPLMLTDKEYKNSVLNIYNVNKMSNAVKNLNNGTWKLPGKDIIEKDSILANMILNPWYTADDPYNTIQDVYYTFDLSNFMIDGNRIYVKSENRGMNLGWYDKIDSKQITNRSYYLYTDNKIIINLPISLYMGKYQSSIGDLKIQIKGKKMKTEELGSKPVVINTVSELKKLLEDTFYKFKEKNGDLCKNLNSSDQQKYDSTCKFFPDIGLGGLVTVLRRIIVIHLPSTVIDEFISNFEITMYYMNVDYLEFFLWMAMKSHRDKITYNFILQPKQKR